MTTQNSGDDANITVASDTDILDEKEHLSGSVLLPQRVLQGIAAIMILALSIFITVAVILRYSGNGIIGVVEITALSMVVITVLVIPAATVADENFRVEVIDFFVRAKTLTRLDVLSLIFQLLVAVFLVLAAGDLLINDIRTATTIGGELGMPRWWVSLPIAIGFLGFLYSSILSVFRLRRAISDESTVSEG